MLFGSGLFDQIYPTTVSSHDQGYTGNDYEKGEQQGCWPTQGRLRSEPTVNKVGSRRLRFVCLAAKCKQNAAQKKHVLDLWAWHSTGL